MLVVLPTVRLRVMLALPLPLIVRGSGLRLVDDGGRGFLLEGGARPLRGARLRRGGQQGETKRESARHVHRRRRDGLTSPLNLSRRGASAAAAARARGRRDSRRCLACGRRGGGGRRVAGSVGQGEEDARQRERAHGERQGGQAEPDQAPRDDMGGRGCMSWSVPAHRRVPFLSGGWRRRRLAGVPPPSSWRT